MKALIYFHEENRKPLTVSAVNGCKYDPISNQHIVFGDTGEMRISRETVFIIHLVKDDEEPIVEADYTEVGEEVNAE